MKALFTALLFCVGVGASPAIRAQQVAVKTNLLYDAMLNINGGIEVGLAPRWSLDFSANYNNWTFSGGKRWKNWFLQPEARYWLCDRFSGHFLGLHLHGGKYNVGGLDNGINFLGSDFSQLGDYRYQGWFAGAGVAYGYAFILGMHWNLELELGLGYAYTRFDKFECVGCGRRMERDKTHHYVGPTKAAVNLVYIF